jgi:hypothetical protein
LSPGDFFLLAWNEDGVADDGTKSINLCAQLDLDEFAGLEGGLCLCLFRDERGIWCDVGVWGDGRRMTDTLGEFLALVDFGNLLVK